MEETNSYIITYLCVIGVAFLASYFLLLRFWLWRWHRWRTSHWSGLLGTGWLLFLVGLAGTLLGNKDSPSAAMALCLFASAVCFVAAFGRYFGQCRALRSMHPPSPSTLSKTFDADPAAKRFILTRYGFTGGLALLFCLSLVVLVTVRTQLTIRSRHQVVALVERGALRPNALGDIRLPRSLARASINGHVYLGSGGNGSGKGQSVIFFPTVSTTYYVDWEDGTPDQRKYQMEGYVYSPKPLPSYYGVGFSDSEIDDLVYLDHEQGTSHWYYGTPWESD